MSAPKAKKKPFEYFIYDFVKVTAAPGILWFRPKVWRQSQSYRKIKGGALLIANHIGYTDPIALQFGIWYRRHHFLCLKEFFEKPVAAWFFRQFHCIPVDRENFSMATLRDVVDRLKNEELVTMFPEGGVGVGSFRSGMVLMSVMSKKPIVPIYIAPRKHFYSRLHMVLGEPVDIAGTYGPMPSLEQIEQITADLHRREERLRLIYEERRKRH